MAAVERELPAVGAAAGGAGFCAPKSSSSDIPSSLTIEYSVLTEGRDLPVSICEIALGRDAQPARQLTQAEPALLAVGSQAGPDVLLEWGPRRPPDRPLRCLLRHRAIVLTFSTA